LYASRKFTPPDGVSLAHLSFRQLMEANNNHGIPHYNSLYTPEIKQKVTRLYDTDIDLLGYSFNS
jgi:hypothetical protein